MSANINSPRKLLVATPHPGSFRYAEVDFKTAGIAVAYTKTIPYGHDAAADEEAIAEIYREIDGQKPDAFILFRPDLGADDLCVELTRRTIINLNIPVIFYDSFTKRFFQYHNLGATCLSTSTISSQEFVELVTTQLANRPKITIASPQAGGATPT